MRENMDDENDDAPEEEEASPVGAPPAELAAMLGGGFIEVSGCMLIVLFSRDGIATSRCDTSTLSVT